VEETIFANEFDCRTAAQIGARIDEVIDNGLPYLVAVARGNQPRGPQGYISEKIVGFISLADLCDRSSMFRFTFELELYVHPGYQSQNIASCLLDRLLEFANTGYRACGGYEYRNDSEYLKTGPGRVIKTIMLSVNKEPGKDVEKTNAFLRRFKFKYVGHKKEMGHKYGKVVDIHEYQHITSEVIDATSKPSVPLERAEA
jgi:GNAT superfamily N-acetyltransferase